MPDESSSRNAGTLPKVAAAGEFEALQEVIAALTPLTEEARRRILESASLFLQVDVRARALAAPSHTLDSRSPPPASPSPYSEDTSMSPKEFLLEKQPRTDVERIAC